MSPVNPCRAAVLGRAQDHDDFGLNQSLSISMFRWIDILISMFRSIDIDVMKVMDSKILARHAAGARDGA
jgi:hypothetical protein